MPLTLHAIVAGSCRRPRRQSISEVVLYAPLVLARIWLREWAAASWGHPWLRLVAGRPNETFDNHQEHAQITREKRVGEKPNQIGAQGSMSQRLGELGVLPAVSETVSATLPPIPIKPHENLADLFSHAVASLGMMLFAYCTVHSTVEIICTSPPPPDRSLARAAQLLEPSTQRSCQVGSHQDLYGYTRYVAKHQLRVCPNLDQQQDTTHAPTQCASQPAVAQRTANKAHQPT